MVGHKVSVTVIPDAVVLNSLPVADREGIVPWCSLTFSHKIGAILVEACHELFLSLHTVNTAKEPSMYGEVVYGMETSNENNNINPGGKQWQLPCSLYRYNSTVYCGIWDLVT